MSSHQNHITAVREFMQAFGQETPKEPLVDSSPPPLEVRRLRAKLILEEALEAVRALGMLPLLNTTEASEEIDIDYVIFGEKAYDYNFIEVLDALCDLDYVGQSGTAVALGIDEELYEKAFQLVHESNMRKLWTYEEILTVKFDNYNFKKILDGGPNDKIWSVTDIDGKKIKSPSWQKPNLEGLLDA